MGFLRALRFACRTLLVRSRSTALVAIAALTLGIAANVAVFTVVERVLLRPLDLPHNERYQQVWRTFRSDPSHQWPFSYLNLRDMAQRNKTFEVLGGITRGDDLNLMVRSPERVEAREITSDLAAAFGVEPALGHWFSADATAKGQTDSAMLAWSLWQKLGADPRIVGNTIRLNDKPYKVAGVLPQWFSLPVLGGEQVQVVLPFDATSGDATERGKNYLLVVGRMRPGVSATQAQADLIDVAQALEREYPEDNKDNTLYLASVVEAITTQDFRETVWSLLAAVALVLLIACCNVASLLLARSVVRTQETGLRVALGANRIQLASQFVAEGLILSLISAVLGLFLSLAIIRLFFVLSPDGIPRGAEIHIDTAVLLVSISLAVFAGLFCSLVPLVQAQRLAPSQVLNDGARASMASRGRRALRLLVAGEVALAFLLVAAALGQWANLDRLRTTALGFDPRKVAITQLSLSSAKYAKEADLVEQQRRILEAVAAIPGVEKVGSIDKLPIRFCCDSYPLFVDGLPSKPIAQIERVEIRAVSEDYYSAMTIPLEAGRFFTAADMHNAASIGIVNQAAVEAYWSGRSPIGSRVRLGDPDSKQLVEIIGVAGDIRNASLEAPTHPEIDLFYPQVADPDMTLAVRSSLPLNLLVPKLEAAVHRLDPQQPLFSTMTMQQVINLSLTQENLLTTMVGLFSSVAVLLAMMGIYSVVSYSVAERVPEIGTRMALGSGTNEVLQLILRDALQMTAIGLVAGAALALVLKLALNGNLPHVSGQWTSIVTALAGFTAGPWWTYLAAVLTVGVATILTCLFPAYRATLVDPMVAVRNDLQSVWKQSRERLLPVPAFAPSRRSVANLAEASLVTELAKANRLCENADSQLKTTVELISRTFDASGVWLMAKNDQGEFPCVAAEGSDLTMSFAAHSKFLQRLKSYTAPLPLTPADLSAITHYYEQNGVAGIEEWRSIERLGVRLALKIALREELIGVILLAPKKTLTEFSNHDRELLQSLSLPLALILENTKLTRRAVEQEKVRNDLLMATEVQKRLFPEHAPKRELLTLAGKCIPARGVGGDYYDFFDLAPAKTGIALADVAGKGIAAALIMSIVQASLRILTTEANLSLAEITARMNKLVLQSTSSSSYATFFYAEIDEANKRLRYVNGGHNPPMLFRGLATAKRVLCEELTVGGMVVGLFGGATYEEAEVTMESGDVLVVFTDGVSEALNPAGEEFGEERLKEAVLARSNLSSTEMVQELMVELKTWIAEAPQHDDMTLMIVRMG